MPTDRPTRGDLRQTAWMDAHPGQQVPGLPPIDPQTGLYEQRPGYVWVAPQMASQYGQPSGWVKAEDFDRGYGHGWNMKQIAVATLPLALGVVGMAGGLGAGGGGSAALPSTSYAGSVAMPATAGAAGAALPSTSLAGSVALPAAVSGSGVASGAGAGGAGMAGFGLSDAVQLAPVVASLFGGHGGNGQAPQSAAMENLINLQTRRLQESDPLYQAILRMAMGLLPTYARQGGQSPTSPQTATPRIANRSY